jgi:hypothetical protein
VGDLGAGNLGGIVQPPSTIGRDVEVVMAPS